MIFHMPAIVAKLHVSSLYYSINLKLNVVKRFLVNGIQILEAC